MSGVLFRRTEWYITVSANIYQVSRRPALRWVFLTAYISVIKKSFVSVQKAVFTADALR